MTAAPIIREGCALLAEPEAAARLGIGARTLRKHRSAGRIIPVLIGHSRCGPGCRFFRSAKGCTFTPERKGEYE